MVADTITDIDESLIRDSQKGDRNAFARLLAIVYDLIYCFALKWLDQASDAEDVTQLVCVKLAKVIRQFRFESAFTTWLYRIVVNCVRDWQRSQKRHLHEDISAAEDHASEQTSESEAELQRVLAEVESMGKGYKETLLLVYAEGFTHAEAAQILDVKESTVSWRLHHIRKHLATLEEGASVQ